jgi:hypothetical protein
VRAAAHCLYLTSDTAYSAHSSCGLRAVRLSSLALHFFPHTRPPDIVARLEYQGSLVNTYSSLDTPASRGPPLGARARRPEIHEYSRAWSPADFPSPSSFTGCTVRCHEDVPRQIYGLFQALGIQYCWVLTRGPLGREFLKAEDLVIDDTKEESWMTVYEHEHDLLEGRRPHH